MESKAPTLIRPSKHTFVNLLGIQTTTKVDEGVKGTFLVSGFQHNVHRTFTDVLDRGHPKSNPFRDDTEIF